MYMDATCYESEMRYPTDSKLLREGIEKSYATMCELSKSLRIHRPRTKFIDVQKANNILVDGISFIEDLARVRATAMEGSFGTQKEHYDLRRVKARTKQTEILYHLLRHPHSKRGAACGQNRAENTVGGLLKRKHAHRNVLSRGNYASVIENGQKIRPKRPERDINLMD